MYPRPLSHSERPSLLLALVFCIFVAACGDQESAAGAKATDDRAELIADESGNQTKRLEAMESLRHPANQEVVEALLLVMKDLSQQTFIMTPDDSFLGYTKTDGEYGGFDSRAELRWTAIRALERLGEKQALPDLISALHDRHPVVRHFAARALWKLGSSKGLDVLLTGLEGKALSNESANRILKEISGKDFNFDTDGGWKAKLEAIAKWKAHAKTMKPAAAHPNAGADADLDRRVRFLVFILGERQFLHMEHARRNLSMMGELAVSHIKSALDDPALGKDKQQLRAYAVQALALIWTESARDLIVNRCAFDPSAPVRSRSALAMANMTSKKSGEALIRLLKDKDESVVTAAVQALGQRSEPGAAELLKAQFVKERASKRHLLITALSLVRLGEKDPRYSGHIEKIMMSGPAHVRAELAELLMEWQGSLNGWDESKVGSEQPEAMATWKKLLRR